MKFSVIIPTYNRPAQLARCLEALEQQSLMPFEVIVVDDGSQPPVSHELSQRFPQVRWLAQPNQGPSAARNRGARASHGEYLAFTDDDCAPAFGWLARLAQSASEHPGATLGGSTLASEHASLYDRVAQRILGVVYTFYNDRPQDANFFASNNLALSREVYQRVGGFDERKFAYVSEDRDLCDRLRQQRIRLVWVQAAVVFHWPRLTLGSYCRMFFRYGRGAARYHQARVQRGTGTLLGDSGFHLKAPALIWQSLQRPPTLPLLPSLALCLLWQLANAAGFLWEKLCGVDGQPPS